MLQFLRNRFEILGFGGARALHFTGHFSKLGGVQLLRFHRCTEAFSMKWFKIKRQQAYLRYTEGYKDCGGLNAPAFKDIILYWNNYIDMFCPEA